MWRCNIKKAVEKSFDAWYGRLPRRKDYGGLPPRGMIAAALIVLERLRKECNLQLSFHLAEGGGQITGLTTPALRKILARYDEKRVFLSEGGRTNRGNPKAVSALLDALGTSEFASLSEGERVSLLDHLQTKLVLTVRAYFKIARIRFDFDGTRPLRSVISDILANAQANNKSGPVAQHLVGAKLELRFPDLEVSNFPFSAADEPGGRSGDFYIGDTAFHVTVAPKPSHFAKCEENIRQGLASWLLVPESELGDARAVLKMQQLHAVAAESVESFVGQNLSEQAAFTSSNFASQLRDLITVYNRRVTEAESDTSLLIDLPAALRAGDE